MSVLTYPPTNDEEIFRHCTKECGIITSTEDLQYFALRCTTCSEKFLFFDAFIEHMQTTHMSYENDGPNAIGNGDSEMCAQSIHNDKNKIKRRLENDSEEDLAAVLQPPVVMIKEENIEDIGEDNDALIKNEPLGNDDEYDYPGVYYGVKQEQINNMKTDHVNSSYMGDSFGSYNDDYAGDDDDLEKSYNGDDANYDDLVEESLLEDSGSSGVTSHIKDRKMIQFLIDAYRRNTFLWDHRHPQFRDRVRRSQFIDYINSEFKKRFNLTLSKDAVTRKWDNLRTVYKRECNRMMIEKSNVSSLWYFKELHFLNRLYMGDKKIPDAIVKETDYRRRYSALWNDASTNQMLHLLKGYPCFYDKFNIDYRSKEKRGEALQKMALELGGILDVTTIQISKRISQLRFDYSKQKQERLMCEMSGREFAPTYSYYEVMFFMDNDIAPFKCEHCPMILNSPRDLDTHLLTHQHKIQNSPHVSSTSSANLYSGALSGPSMGGSNYYCPVCQLGFNDLEQFSIHKQIHPTLKEVKYHCDLCTASFREKNNFDEHMRRHNDELLIPDLTLITPDICDNNALITDDVISNSSPTLSDDVRGFRCHYPGCGKQYTKRYKMTEHVRSHYSDEEFNCDICGKMFRSVKNLHNHKQIHDAVKKYICKICGSAFAQAAGLYLHKRRHRRHLERC